MSCIHVIFQISGHRQGAQAARASAGDTGSQINAVAMLAAEPARTEFPTQLEMSSVVLRGFW